MIENVNGVLHKWIFIYDTRNEKLHAMFLRYGHTPLLKRVTYFMDFVTIAVKLRKQTTEKLVSFAVARAGVTWLTPALEFKPLTFS